MLFYFQVLLFKYSFFISKCRTVSPVVYTVTAPHASVSAEVPVCQVLGSGCQTVSSQDTTNGQSKLLKRKEKHEWKK